VSPVELAPEQGDFALAKTDGTMTPPQGGAENNISAADYNPDLDRLEDEERARQRAQKGQPQGTDELAAGTGEAKERIEGDESEWEEVEVEEDDEVEDMFALGSDDEDAPKKKKTIRVRKGTARPGAVSLL
jgi:serine/threonine-protein kinase PRP4